MEAPTRCGRASGGAYRGGECGGEHRRVQGGGEHGGVGVVAAFPRQAAGPIKASQAETST